jgi:tellurite resistance protein TerC
VSGVSLFPFREHWEAYVGFLLLVLVLLALDLGVFHRKAHTVSFKEAASWSLVWVSLALAFNFGFYRFMLDHFANEPRLLAIPGFDPAAAARQTALEFLAGYVVEYCSVDSTVFVVVLTYFGVPRTSTACLLRSWGPFFRAIFIALGRGCCASSG